MNANEKKYLKWYNKLGYGSGDLAANCIYALLTSFVMIYLTDTVGLKASVIGMLIMVSKCLDGVSDVFFGNLMVRLIQRWEKQDLGCYGLRLERYLPGSSILQFRQAGALLHSMHSSLLPVHFIKCSILYSK